MNIELKDYRVQKGDEIDLKKRKTSVDPVYRSEAHYKKILAGHVSKLSDVQERHYAANNHAMLVIVQAMDAAGKDGIIRHVMSGVNPQGCQVSSFKRPTAAELGHDFLWRTTAKLPERGQIGIFNRSYYEEVLITKAHPGILEDEGLPDSGRKHAAFWKERYRSITNFERHLHANDTRIVKIYLHLSKEEQRKRFLARIGEPDKNWKFNPADIDERGFWKEYRKAYEDCIRATSTADSPWYVVPADDKQNARLIVSQIVVDALEALKPKFPTLPPERVWELQAIRQTLIADSDSRL